MKVAHSTRRPWIAALALAAGALAFLPTPTAHAAFALKDLSSAPDDPRAGAHSDYRIHIGFEDPGQDLKDLTISLPPGVSGNPTVPQTCTVERFEADSCPDGSLVGEVEAETSVQLLPPPLPAVPSTASGSIFNITAQPGEPARFGVQLRPVVGLEVATIHSQIAVQLRPTDFGLDSILRDVPNTAMGIPIDINAMSIRLFGQANGGPFMGNPTSCQEAVTRFAATSYGEPGVTATGQASFTPTDCASLPFSPKLTAKVGAPGLTKIGTNPPLTSVIEQDLGEANLRRAAVALPEGIGAANATLNSACPLDQFNAGTCPDASHIGTARARSPLLPAPLTGDVILVIPPNALPQVGLDLHGPLSLRLMGALGEAAGGSGAVFDGLPDIPIASFQLNFNGGPKGLLVNQRDLCAPPAPKLNAEFDAHSGAQRTASATATVEGCGGGGEPKASVKLKRATSSRPRLSVDVDAGSDPLRKATVKLPSALRFAGGRAWKRGADAAQEGGGPDPKLRHTKRTATIRSRGGAGAEGLELDAGKGALRAAKEIKAGKRLAFAIKVRDTNGDVTTLKKRVRARR